MRPRWRAPRPASERVATDGTVLVVATSDVVSVWDLAARRERARFNPFCDGEVECCATDGTHVVLGGASRVVLAFATSGQFLHELGGAEKPIASVAVAGKRAAAASTDDYVRVWDLDTGACLRLVRQSYLISCVGIAPAGVVTLAGVAQVMGPRQDRGTAVAGRGEELEHRDGAGRDVRAE